MKSSDIYRQLFSKKLLFITGKGGVGKSTLVYHLAKQATFEFDKEVTVYSVGQSGFYEDKITNRKDRKVLLEGKEVKLFPGATVQVLQTYPSFLEYVHAKVKIPKLLLNLTDHPRIRNVFLAMPGLSQTVLLGKIWYEAQRRAQNNLGSLVIVEAPPLGQAEQFFSINQTVKVLFKMGPFFNDAQHVERALHDPSFCEMVLVTLLDDLPVDETTEYVTTHHNSKLLLRYLICNRVVFAQEHQRQSAPKELLSHPIGGYLYRRESHYFKSVRKLPLSVWAFPDYVDLTQRKLVEMS